MIGTKWSALVAGRSFAKIFFFSSFIAATVISAALPAPAGYVVTLAVLAANTCVSQHGIAVGLPGAVS